MNPSQTRRTPDNRHDRRPCGVRFCARKGTIAWPRAWSFLIVSAIAAAACAPPPKPPSVRPPAPIQAPKQATEPPPPSVDPPPPEPPKPRDRGELALLLQ